MVLMVSGEPIPIVLQGYAVTGTELKTKNQIYSVMVVCGLLTYENEGVKNFVSLEVHASLDKSSICRNLLSVLGIFCCRIFLLILL